MSNKKVTKFRVQVTYINWKEGFQIYYECTSATVKDYILSMEVLENDKLVSVVGIPLANVRVYEIVLLEEK